MPEGAPTILESEPKAISVEKTKDGFVSIEVGENARPDFYNIITAIDTFLDDKGLFELIPDNDEWSIMIRPYMEGEQVPDEVFEGIKDQIAAMSSGF